jgi:hypothetical protein
MHPPPCPRRVFREIGWPQETRVAADIGDDLTLIPDVIAGRQDVDPTIVELAAKAFGQAETARRVLGVYHHEIDVELPPQAGYMLSYGITAGSPYHVAAKQNFH